MPVPQHLGLQSEGEPVHPHLCKDSLDHHGKGLVGEWSVMTMAMSLSMSTARFALYFPQPCRCHLHCRGWCFLPEREAHRSGSARTPIGSFSSYSCCSFCFPSFVSTSAVASDHWGVLSLLLQRPSCPSQTTEWLSKPCRALSLVCLCSTRHRAYPIIHKSDPEISWVSDWDQKSTRPTKQTNRQTDRQTGTQRQTGTVTKPSEETTRDTSIHRQ